MKLLVFNCHEAWVYQLAALGYHLDIIVGLKGRYTAGWDERMRPVPKNGRIISLSEALRTDDYYDCIIAHNITDMLDIKSLQGPRIIVLHNTLDGRLSDEASKVSPEKMRNLLLHYLKLVGGHAVAVSSLKGNSWDLPEDIVNSGVNPADYLPYKGDKAKGLRICNEISKRRKTLLWGFFEKVFGGAPMVDIVGHNPDMQGIAPARSWNHLKEMLSSYRFYVHTADPRFEDGFNMAVLEAMAAGMPILGNLHPTSPVEHGISGFLSNDPDKLRSYARMLIEDQDLAIKMGRAARKIVAQRFSLSNFRKRFECSIKIARQKWEEKRMASNDYR